MSDKTKQSTLNYTEIREDVLFVSFGGLPREGAFIIPENGELECTIKEIKRSQKYSTKDRDVFIYTVEKKDSKPDEPLLILMPTTDLMKQFDTVKEKYGKAIEVGDKIKITYLGDVPTNKGKPMKTFKLGVVM